MSLVAAYSDSENEDDENITPANNDKEKLKLHQDSNEVLTHPQQDIGENIYKGEGEQGEQDIGENILDEDEWESSANTENKTSLFNILPKPKTVVLNKFVAEEEETEDEFLHKKAKIDISDVKPNKNGVKYKSNNTDAEVKHSFMNLPKPSNKKERVKISLPKLQVNSDDSDNENDSPTDNMQHTKSSSMKCSLFTMLPKPKHSVTVGENINRMFDKKTNRSLVPHTLTKKTATEANSKINKKKKNDTDSDYNLKKKNIDSEMNEESDGEDEVISSNNFFAFNSESVSSEEKHIFEKNGDKTEHKIDLKDPSGFVIDTTSSVVAQSMSENNKSAVKNNSYFASLINSKKETSATNVPSRNMNSSAVVSINNTTYSEVTPPYGQSATHQSNVTAPYGQSETLQSNVTAPYGQSSTLHRNVTAPYGQSSTLQSNVTAPYGQSSTLHRNVTAPYGQSLTLQSNVTAPYGQSLTHQSNVTAPYGQSSTLQSNVTAPYGQSSTHQSYVTAPYGQSSTLHSNVTAPYGQSSTLQSNVTAPYGQSSTQQSNVTAPYGQSSTRQSNVSAPYDQTLHSSVTAPYGQIKGKQSQAQQSERFFNYAYHKAPIEDNQSIDSTHIDNDNEVSNENEANNDDLPITEDVLTALQGKGKKRHKEVVNIIDVKASNLQMSSEEYLKNFSKQSGYQSKKSKNHQPSHKQKRKHQITYLAFQAKEREQELQQAWAEGRATKQQTQSRYGF